MDASVDSKDTWLEEKEMTLLVNRTFDDLYTGILYWPNDIPLSGYYTKGRRHVFRFHRHTLCLQKTIFLLYVIHLKIPRKLVQNCSHLVVIRI